MVSEDLRLRLQSEKNLSLRSHLPLVKVCTLRHRSSCVSRLHVNGHQAIQMVFQPLFRAGDKRYLSGAATVYEVGQSLYEFTTVAGEKQVSKRPR